MCGRKRFQYVGRKAHPFVAVSPFYRGKAHLVASLVKAAQIAQIPCEEADGGQETKKVKPETAAPWLAIGANPKRASLP